MSPEPEWIDHDVVQMFHARQLAEHGGAEGIRDEGLRQSALARPEQLWCDGSPSPDLCALAAAHAFGLARNQPFLDGNKRTSAITCELFLYLNGVFFTVDETQKYLHYLALASGEHSEESFADWLRSVTA